MQYQGNGGNVVITPEGRLRGPPHDQAGEDEQDGQNHAEDAGDDDVGAMVAVVDDTARLDVVSGVEERCQLHGPHARECGRGVGDVVSSLVVI